MHTYFPMASIQTHSSSILGFIIFIAFYVSTLFTTSTDAAWFNHGAGLTNSRNAVGESRISRESVSRLRLRWRFDGTKDVSATPAVFNRVVYFPAWDGNLYAVSADSGRLIWKQNLSELTGLKGTGVTVNVTVSRSTPAIAADLLIVGIYGPAVVIAVARNTGRLVWMTQIDRRPRAVITTSATELLGGVYVGVSSLEESLPARQCCIFRGSLVRLNTRTGAITWQTYTLPDNGGRLGGYSGAAIWGSSPAIDLPRRLVYVATGNLYTAPPEVLRCQEQQNKNRTRPTHPDQCFGPDIHFNSILAIDINSGRIRWSRQLGGYDVFYLACLVPNNPDCPPGPNVDADFGEAPMLLQIRVNGTRRDVAVAVQKSGFAWALDRDNGNIVWFKLAGPGGFEGGGIWGAATDGIRIYTNIANSNRVQFALAPSIQTTTAGAWVALNADTGRIEWTTANPSNDTAQAPVTLANGVLFAGSVASHGPLYAMDARNGRILWSYDTGATIYGGAAVSYGCVYIGHGYSVSVAKFHPTWTPGNSLFAFCV